MGFYNLGLNNMNYSNFIKDFGFKLKLCRESLNMTKKFVANHIGVSVATISNWERGFTSPTFYYFYKLLKLYDCTASEFYMIL